VNEEFDDEILYVVVVILGELVVTVAELAEIFEVISQVGPLPLLSSLKNEKFKVILSDLLK